MIDYEYDEPWEPLTRMVITSGPCLGWIGFIIDIDEERTVNNDELFYAVLLHEDHNGDEMDVLPLVSIPESQLSESPYQDEQYEEVPGV